MLITPEILEVIGKAVDAQGEVTLAKLLGVLPYTIQAWQNGWSKSINSRLWENCILPVLSRHMSARQRLRIVTASEPPDSRTPQAEVPASNQSQPPTPAPLKLPLPPPLPLTGERIIALAGKRPGKTGKLPRRLSPGQAGGSALSKPQGKRIREVRQTDRLLTRRTILSWASKHFEITGRWPTAGSGQISQEPGESWRNIDFSLRRGHRGLPGGSSLSKLIRRYAKSGRFRRPELTEDVIRLWAGEHFKRHGKWPTQKSGLVGGTSWGAISQALARGYHGLPHGSLSKLLQPLRGEGKPPLTEERILAWADEHHARTGRWPVVKSGFVLTERGEKWARIDASLDKGLRGLSGGSSLTKLLAERRGKRNIRNLPKLTEEGILQLADEHRERTGFWPMADSSPAGDTNWTAIDNGLRMGLRGLPGGSSLAKLLAERRGKANPSELPRLNERMILSWADAHRKRTGKWPSQRTGLVQGAPGEKWMNISVALREGTRGLPGGSSLAKLLNARRAGKGRVVPFPLTEEGILVLADLHRTKTGRWPSNGSGPIEGTSWAAIEQALIKGQRGLPGGSSIAKLLAERRGKRNMGELPPLDVERILEWADEHRARTGQWPAVKSGPVHASPEETWARINEAMANGYRSLPGGSSLAKLIIERRNAWSPTHPPPLTEERILEWAREHRERAGEWPSAKSGPVHGAPGESWGKIAVALADGRRGLAAGLSLVKLLAEHNAAAKTEKASGSS